MTAIAIIFTMYRHYSSLLYALVLILSWGQCSFAFVHGNAPRANRQLVGVLSSTANDEASPSFGLYQVQEQLIIDRGQLEEKLMADNYTPLQANKPKVRGTGGSGGFGGGSSGKSSATLKAEGKAHAKVLKQDGVVRIDSVLSDKMADELRDFVFELRQQAEEDVESGKVKSLHRFADVLLRTNRCDLTIPLGPEVVTNALVEIFLKSPVRYTIESLLTKKAVLQELSCLMSYPGSQRQVIHPDTPYGAMGGLSEDEPVLYTCFIALQDVEEDMGPTVWLPNTHTLDAHEQFKDEQSVDGKDSPKDALLRTTPSKLGMLPKGSMGVFDSRLLHCGGANRSANDATRAIFYFSFKNPKIGYPGNPGSIRPELVSKLTLDTLCKDLEMYSKGKGCPQLDELAASLK